MKPRAKAFLSILLVIVVLSSFASTNAQGDVKKATPGKKVDMVLLPKFLGLNVFDQANQGAQEAHKELGNTGKLEFLGPTPDNPTGQIDIIKAAVTRGVNAIMVGNNAGDQLTPAAKDALSKGVKVVSWDSAVLDPTAENLFVAQVDFDKMGATMAQMALDIIGPDGGDFAILSSNPNAQNQNAWIASMKDALAKDPKFAKLHLLDTVYGNDTPEDSTTAALGLVDKYKTMKLIMAPTTVGAAAASKALTDEGLCDKVKLSGLALPSEMQSFVKSGCAPEIALWSFVDLGYTTYYAAYMLATGDMKGTEGETFQAGRMGNYTIEKDPGRKGGLRVVMGPFTIYNKDNIDAAVGGPATPAATMAATASK